MERISLLGKTPFPSNRIPIIIHISPAAIIVVIILNIYPTIALTAITPFLQVIFNDSFIDGLAAFLMEIVRLTTVESIIITALQ